MESARKVLQEKERGEKFIINVSGHRYVTTKDTLAKYPATKLGKLLIASHQSTAEHFFDEDVDVFKEVLRFQKTGDLHVPKSICRETFLKHLKFWEISEDHLSSCCRADDKLNDAVLEKQFQWFEKRILPEGKLTWRHHLWYFLADPMGPYTSHKKAATWFAVLYVLLVCIELVNLSLLTLPGYIASLNITTRNSFRGVLIDISNQPCIIANAFIRASEFSVGLILQSTFSVLFLIEVCLRLISCPKQKYFWSSLNVLDFFTAVSQFTGCMAFLSLGSIQKYLDEETECIGLMAGWIVFYVIIQFKVFRLLSQITMIR